MLKWIQENSKRLASAGAVVAGAAAVYGLLNYVSQLAGIAFISAFIQAAVVLGAYFAYGPIGAIAVGDDPIAARARSNRQATVLFGLYVLAPAVFALAVFVTALRPDATSASALVSGLWIPFGGILLGAAALLRYQRDLKDLRERIQLASRCVVGAGVLGLGGGVLALAIARGTALVHSHGAIGLHLQSRAGADFWSIASEGVLICGLGIAFVSGALDDVAWLSVAVGAMIEMFGVSEWIAQSRGYAIAVIAMGILAIAYGITLFIRKAPRRLNQALLIAGGMAGLAIMVTAYGTRQPQVAVSAALLSAALLTYSVALNLAPWEEEASRRLEEEGRTYSARLSFLHLQAEPSPLVLVRLAFTTIAASASVWVLIELVNGRHIGPLTSFSGVAAALVLIVVIQLIGLTRAIRRRGRPPVALPVS